MPSSIKTAFENLGKNLGFFFDEEISIEVGQINASMNQVAHCPTCIKAPYQYQLNNIHQKIVIMYNSKTTAKVKYEQALTGNDVDLWNEAYNSACRADEATVLAMTARIRFKTVWVGLPLSFFVGLLLSLLLQSNAPIQDVDWTPSLIFMSVCLLITALVYALSSTAAVMVTPQMKEHVLRKGKEAGVEITTRQERSSCLSIFRKKETVAIDTNSQHKLLPDLTLLVNPQV